MRFEFTDEEMRRWRTGLGAALIVLGLLQVGLWAAEESPRSVRVLLAVAGLLTVGASAWRAYVTIPDGPRITLRAALAAYLIALGWLIILGGLGPALAAGWLWGIALAAVPWQRER